MAEVQEVRWGQNSAWLDVPTSLMLLCLLVGAIVAKSKKIEEKT